MDPATAKTAPPTPDRWTVDDVLAAQWVIMRFLAMGTPSRETIQRRLHWADHMLPCLQTPCVKGFGFDQIPDVGPLLALCSFLSNCQRRPDDWEWCRAVLREAQVDVPTLLATVEPLAHLYAEPHDVPVQIFQSHPDAYALVPLEELPYGGSMHNCDYQSYFDDEKRRIGRVPRFLRLPVQPRDDKGERTEAGRRLTEAVIRGELDGRSCRQHQDPIDWVKVNAAAERIRTTVRPWTKENVRTASEGADHLTQAERLRLKNLFVDPIRWDRGEREVTGGQHRLCGYRLTGATHAFVSVGLPDDWEPGNPTSSDGERR